MADSLLLRAIVCSNPDEASSAWRQWRASIDIERLPWEVTQILPALNGRLNGLLRDDPAAGLLQGFARRAWTESQIRLRVAHSTAAELRAAGCDPVALIGAAAVFLLNRFEHTVRPVPDIRLLIRRQDVALAARTLSSHGWSLHGEIPTGDEFDSSCFISFSKESIPLYLHWRVLANSSCEDAFLDNLQTVAANGAEYVVLGNEFALLAVLGAADDPDGAPWEVDAALLPLDRMDWTRWAAIAERFEPLALARLEHLRELGVNLPEIPDSRTVTIIEGDAGLSLKAWWREYREHATLLRYLAARDVRLRFRNLSLGLLWTILQPLLPALIFAVVFSRILQPATVGVPYSLFALAGLAPWSFFSSAVSSAGMTFAWNANLLNKVYFPRAILPVSSVLASSIELAVGCVLLAGYSVMCGYPPRWSWLLLPVAACAIMLLACFVSLGLATLNALHREVKFAVPFAMQLWMYASPVVYPASLIPGRYRWLLGFNPLTWALETFRWAFFGSVPDTTLFWMSVASSLAVAAIAVGLFRAYEGSVPERL